MVSLSGRRTDWIDYKDSPKYLTKGPADYFDYNYKTNKLMYNLVAPVIKYFLQKVFWKVKVEGTENIPRDRNFVLMPNHISHMDSVFAVPNLYPRLSEGIHAIADEKLFKSPFFRAFAKAFNAFPVRKGSKNLNIVKYAAKRIQNGDSMLWYPEGQRHKNPSVNHTNTGKLGSGLLAHSIDAPIIPCFLAGTEFVMPVGKGIKIGKIPRSINVLVRYGKPVYLDDLRKLPPSPEVSQEVVERIMRAIENLRPNGGYKDQSHKI